LGRQTGGNPRPPSNFGLPAQSDFGLLSVRVRADAGKEWSALARDSDFRTLMCVWRSSSYANGQLLRCL
jgi:hypothetical protein